MFYHKIKLKPSLHIDYKPLFVEKMQMWNTNDNSFFDTTRDHLIKTGLVLLPT